MLEKIMANPVTGILAILIAVVSLCFCIFAVVTFPIFLAEVCGWGWIFGYLFYAVVAYAVYYAKSMDDEVLQ